MSDVVWITIKFNEVKVMKFVILISTTQKLNFLISVSWKFQRVGGG